MDKVLPLFDEDLLILDESCLLLLESYLPILPKPDQMRNYPGQLALHSTGLALAEPLQLNTLPHMFSSTFDFVKLNCFSSLLQVAWYHAAVLAAALQVEVAFEILLIVVHLLEHPSFIFLLRKYMESFHLFGLAWHEVRRGLAPQHLLMTLHNVAPIPGGSRTDLCLQKCLE